MWTRKQIKTKAKEVFKVNYWKCVLVGLIFCVIVGGASGTFSGGVSGMSSTGSGLMYNRATSTAEDDMDDLENEFDEIADNIDEIENSEGEDTAVGITIASTDEDGTEIDMDTADVAIGIAAFGFFFIAMMIIILIATVIGFAIKIFLINPVEYGCKNFFRRNLDEPANLSSVTFGFDFLPSKSKSTLTVPSFFV